MSLPKPAKEKVLLMSDGSHVPTMHEYVETQVVLAGSGAERKAVAVNFFFKCSETGAVRQYGCERFNG